MCEVGFWSLSSHPLIARTDDGAQGCQDGWKLRVGIGRFRVKGVPEGSFRICV